MRIIDRISIENFGVLRKADFYGFKDLNILIGPNNCGKTTALKSILKLRKMENAKNVACGLCQDAINGQNPRILNSKRIPIHDDEKYLNEKEVKLSFYLNEDGINSIMPDLLNEAKQALAHNKCNHGTGLIFSKNQNEYVELHHISPFCHDKLVRNFADEILFCPDDRLGSYFGKDFKEYIRQKNLTGRQFLQWIEYLKDIVDFKLIDYDDSIDLVRNYPEKDFVTALNQQGSGIRSFVCIYADIICSNSHILIIDEPELGLNPLNKQRVLHFLLEQSQKRQVFLSTHDPTFLNPILWSSPNVSVYLYSPYNKEYVKIDLAQSDNDPETFGGYLPHTSSLRDIHIYVEGTSDVYIFQSFLRKYCRAKYKDENWSEILNRVGIFHLGGDFWCHLLHTLPDHPYKCIVILDGDKKQKAQEVCKFYSECQENMAKIKFTASIDQIKPIINDAHSHPVYCLSKDCIELYLGLNDCKPSNYNKKIDGPNLAEKAPIPREIADIFWSILD